MADELTDTQGLRLIAWSLEGGNVKMADECRRAANEIERLRAAGDALATAAGDIYDGRVWIADLIAAWEEARRG